MTRKVYYENPYQAEFEAAILNQQEIYDGWQVELDRTCFYPGGGGQPADTGWLQEMPVLKVYQQSETIYHLVKKKLTSNPVRGRIDKKRRKDYMQQHTGQHLISACLLKTGDFPTVSVHFGEETTAIEIDSGEISKEKMLEAERLANSIIEKNLAVRTHWATPDDVVNFPLRRRPPEKEHVRIVEIENFDFSACGGTHLNTTGEIRLVKWVHDEKIRNRRRLHFKIGDRAFADYQERIEVLGELSHLLSCRIREMPDSIRKIRQKSKEQNRELNSLRKEFVALKAQELLAQADSIHGIKIVTKLWRDVHPEIISGIVPALLSGSRCRVWLVNLQNGQVLWTLAHSPGLTFPIKEFIQPLLEEFGAKGGGKDNVFRGKLEPSGMAEQFFERVKDGILKETGNA